MNTNREGRLAPRTRARFLNHLYPSVALMVALGSFAACVVSTGDEADDEAALLDESAEWNQAYDDATGGKADAPGCSGMVVPDQGGFGKRIALTFDDGPSLTTTPRVLDILASHHIKGTFFINGSRLSSDAARQVLGRIIQEGHIAGNHSQTHQNLKNVSAAKLEQEISLTQAGLHDAGAEPSFFRFPYGSAGCYAAGQVRSHGYAVTGWHIDSADWCFASGGGHCPASTFKYVPNQYRSDIVGYVLSQARSNGGGIVLMHDIHPNTVDHLETIIQTLLDDGFTFVGVDDESTFPLLNGATAPFVGTLCDEAADCSFTAGNATGECLPFGAPPSADKGYCTLDCEGYCPDAPGKAPTFCTSLDGGQSGHCVPKSHALNHSCADLPGTAAKSAARFVGSSSAPAGTALVCLPQ